MLTEKLCMLKMTAIKKISLTGGKGPQASKQTKCITAKKKRDIKGKSCLITRFSYHLQYSLLPRKGWKRGRCKDSRCIHLFFKKATETLLELRSWHLKYAYLKIDTEFVDRSLALVRRILHINGILF